MTTHHTYGNEENDWNESTCGVDDGGETTNTMVYVDCWECLACLGADDQVIEDQCGPSDYNGEGPVLRALGVL